MDGRDENGKPIMLYQEDYFGEDGTRAIMLGHSCDEWVIGTPAQAREFIKQLEVVIKHAETHPDEDYDSEEQS